MRARARSKTVSVAVRGSEALVCAFTVTSILFTYVHRCSNLMHAPDPCTQLSRPSPSIYPPDRSIPMSTCMSPTCACVLPAETMMRFLRAGGQIEWLSIMTVMHGLRAARQSMLSARARLPRLILGAAAPACASRHAQAAIITTRARPHMDHRRTWLARTESCPV